MHYGIFAAIVRLSIRPTVQWVAKIVPALAAVLRYASDFIDKLYRFGYSNTAQMQNEKILDFWKDLDLRLDNFAPRRFDLAL
jgi:hypothetical protein